jgi:hypothetical protein
LGGVVVSVDFPSVNSTSNILLLLLSLLLAVNQLIGIVIEIDFHSSRGLGFRVEDEKQYFIVFLQKPISLELNFSNLETFQLFSRWILFGGLV